MQADGMLTFLGLVLAAWAITPAERLYDLRVRMTWMDWAIVAIAIGILHYILFLPVLEDLGVALDLGPWRWSFTPELASYGILAGATILVALRVWFGPLKRRKVAAFRRQSEQLLFGRKYAELIFLVDRNLSSLVRAHLNRYVSPKLRKKLEPPTWDTILDSDRMRNESGIWARLGGGRRAVARLLPSYSKSQEAATNTLRRVKTRVAERCIRKRIGSHRSRVGAAAPDLRHTRSVSVSREVDFCALA